MRRWGLLLLGLGAGTVAGALLGRSAMLPALIVAVVGLFALAAKSGSGSGDLGETRTAAPTLDAGSAETTARTSAKDLGSRVENILGLAEKQAADCVAEAKVTAAHIVAQAQAEAERLKPQ